MKYIVLLLVILGLFVAGCTAPTPVVTTPEPTPEPEVVAPVVEEVVVPKEPVLSDDAKSLKEMLSATLTYGVTYSYTASSTTSNTRGTITQYIDGIKKMRFDSTFGGITTQTYNVDGVYTSCVKVGANWNCFKPDVSAGQTNSPLNSNDDVVDNVANYKVTRLPDQKILGTDATCYKVETSEKDSVEYCFNSDSVPVLVKTTTVQGGYPATVELLATTYTKTVAADKFVPPQVVTG